MNNHEDETALQAFTQEQVDRIVAARIARERVSFEGYETLRGVLDSLRAAGALHSTSVKGMAGELTAIIKERKEPQVQPSETVTAEVPDSAQNDGQDIVPDEDTTLTQGTEAVLTSSDMMEEANPTSPDEQVRRALAFSSYAAQNASAGLPLSVLYEHFEKLYSIITGTAEHINNVIPSDTVRSARRELAGTAHGVSRTQSDYMLTPRQMELARSAGMSRREYAALLGGAREYPGRK